MKKSRKNQKRRHTRRRKQRGGTQYVALIQPSIKRIDEERKRHCATLSEITAVAEAIRAMNIEHPDIRITNCEPANLDTLKLTVSSTQNDLKPAEITELVGDLLERIREKFEYDDIVPNIDGHEYFVSIDEGLEFE